MDRHLKNFIDIDRELVTTASTIKILSAIAWPTDIYQEFSKNVRKRNPKLPILPPSDRSYEAQKTHLKALLRRIDVHHPIGRFLYQTTQSYLIAAYMLENMGKPLFKELSIALYGQTKDSLSTKLSNLQAAEEFIKSTDEMINDSSGSETGLGSGPLDIDGVVSGEEGRLLLENAAKDFFGEQAPVIAVDPNLSPKAIAGAERMRIRGNTNFTTLEIQQLIHHELYVHTGTILNGRAQPNLKSLGLSAPRTTYTQEGLATFAELITNTMDLERLRRIALRIKGVHVAEQGGDFLDVYHFFRRSGQSEMESYQSTARIFRGGDPKGGIYFTKDLVYLKGLISVHTFLRKSIESRKVSYLSDLFIGRISLGDVIILEPYIESGFIKPAHYLPQWVANQSSLAAYLSYAVFANKINLAEIALMDFVEHLPKEIFHEDLAAI